jgi:hypothetical protein
MAAATTIVMAGAAAASAGSSFIQANKQKKIANKAQRDADKFMAAAKKKLSVNYMDELSLNMQPYERAREQNLVTSSAAMQQGVEGDERGGAATAGKMVQAAQKQEKDIQDQQIGAMQDLEKASAEEDTALRDAKVQLDLGQYQGNVDRAANAEATRRQMNQQGLNSTMKLVGMGVSEFAPLWEKGAGNVDMSGLNANQSYKSQTTPNTQLQVPQIGQSLNLQTSNPSMSMFNSSPQNLLNQGGNNPYMLGNSQYTGLNMFNQ